MNTNDDIMAEVKALGAKVASMEAQVLELTAEVAATKDIVHAVAAVKFGGSLLMWLGKVLLAIGVAAVVLKSGFTALFIGGANHNH